MGSGIFSVIVPPVVIFLAILKKRVIFSLVTGNLLGGILLAKRNILLGLLAASKHLISAVASEESIYILFFLFLFGAFAEIMKVSGGIKGFSKRMGGSVRTEKGAIGMIWAVTPFTFIDCCFHDIAAGTVSKALAEKTHTNKRRLAFVLNVTSFLLIILT